MVVAVGCWRRGAMPRAWSTNPTVDGRRLDRRNRSQTLRACLELRTREPETGSDPDAYRTRCDPARRPSFRSCALASSGRLSSQPGRLRSLGCLIRARDAWHLCLQDRLELARVQAAPPTHPRVVTRALATALGAMVLSRARLDTNRHLLRRVEQLDVDDLPRARQSENPRVQLAVLHGRKVRELLSPQPLLRLSALGPHPGGGRLQSSSTHPKPG